IRCTGQSRREREGKSDSGKICRDTKGKRRKEIGKQKDTLAGASLFSRTARRFPSRLRRCFLLDTSLRSGFPCTGGLPFRLVEVRSARGLHLCASKGPLRPYRARSQDLHFLAHCRRGLRTYAPYCL